MNDRFSADDLPMTGRSVRPTSPWPVDLAHHRPFLLGKTDIRPATREVVRGDRHETLEPRVMQVLVVLASARGAILSRDDLIAACWHGRAVTDDAVNRVISRLRALARSFGGFEVETITKVGYRLVVEGQKSAAPPSPDRRRLIQAGGAVAGLAVVGLGAWRFVDRPSDSADGKILLQKGITTLQNVDIIEAPEPGMALQALTLLASATEAMPKSSLAWGTLAMAYAARKRAVAKADRPGLDARGREAARVALDLDPNQASAIAALRLLDPPYRKWIAAERANREAYEQHPKVAVLGAIMSNFLGGVGRWQEAATYLKRINRRVVAIPGMEWRLLVDLWSSGELQAADHQREFAVKRWPQHALVWRTGVTYLMYSGRPGEALRILRDAAEAPIEIRPDHLATLRETAEGLARQRPLAQAVARNLAYLRDNPGFALQAAQACAALGSAATAFALLDGYYFGEGEWSGLAPVGGDEDRNTGPLFQPVMKPLWRDPRFTTLLERIGLEDYWRRSGTLPDYRRP